MKPFDSLKWERVERLASQWTIVFAKSCNGLENATSEAADALADAVSTAAGLRLGFRPFLLETSIATVGPAEIPETLVPAQRWSETQVYPLRPLLRNSSAAIVSARASYLSGATRNRPSLRPISRFSSRLFRIGSTFRSAFSMPSNINTLPSEQPRLVVGPRTPPWTTISRRCFKLASVVSLERAIISYWRFVSSQ